MKVHFPSSVVGVKGALVVLEIEFQSKARRVRVRGFEGLEPLDLRGENVGGTYDVPEGVPRLHVPMRVTRDGSGRGKVSVVVEDGKGAVPPETWEGEIVLEPPPAGVAKKQMAWLVGAFAVVVAAILWFVVVPLFREPEVPNLVGKTPEEAERSLRSLGYVPERETVVAPDAAGEGKVIAQVPEPGTRRAFGDSVTITVGRRPAGVSVPDLAGKSVEEAEKAIADQGLVAKVRLEDADADRVGKILSQDPAVGGRVPPGGTVTLVVGRAREAEAKDVPDLAGLSRGEAEKALADRGFVAKVVEEDAPPDQVGKVLRQDPATGGRAPAGSEVTLFVGRTAGEAPLVALPDMMGRSRAEAEKALADAGFTVTVTEVDSAGNEGKVVGQSPGAGVSPKGARIELMVGKGGEVPTIPPPPVDTRPPTPPDPPPTVPPTGAAPDVLGLARLEAEGAVRAAGFGTRVSFEDTSDEVREGIVLRQSPVAGDPVPEGVVEFVISRRAPAKGRTMPDVVGKSEGDATAALRAETLLVKPTYVESDASQRGFVTSQQPAAGAPVEEGSWTEIAVGSGPSAAPPVDTAQPPRAPYAPPPNDPRLPKPIHLAPGQPLPPPVRTGAAPTLAPAPPAAVAPGTTTPGPSRPPSTTPAPATPGGRTFFPPTSAGGPLAYVPYVSGTDAHAAIEAVLRAGLVPLLQSDPDPRAQLGRVRTQVPAAGTALSSGSVVHLSVGGGYGTGAVDVPNVTGLFSADAAARLSASGIRSQSVTVPTSFTWAPRGTVVAQSPLGPSARSQAGLVTLWISGP